MALLCYIQELKPFGSNHALGVSPLACPAAAGPTTKGQDKKTLLEL